MISDPLAWLWRGAVAALAANGLDDAFGLPFTVGLTCLLFVVVLEMLLREWFRRHPLGSMKRVVTLVLLRLSQPLVWALAAVGLVVE
jgi:uncharacterized membrane protein YkvI